MWYILGVGILVVIGYLLRKKISPGTYRGSGLEEDIEKEKKK